MTTKRFIGKITARGTPAPMGSKKGFFNQRIRRVIICDDNPKRKKAWSRIVTDYASLQWSQASLEKSQPVSLTMRFTFRRPKSHMTSKGVLTRAAPTAMTLKPDLDKLVRCVKDCLTGIVYHDDSQVVEELASKHYGETEGVEIWIAIVGQE